MTAPPLEGWTFYDLPKDPCNPAVYLVPPGRDVPMRLSLASVLPPFRQWFAQAVRSQSVPSELVAALLGSM
jgi:hypothetical protein